SHHLLRRGELPALPADRLARHVHAPRLPRLRAGDAVAERRRRPAHALRHGARAAHAHLLPQHRRGGDPKPLAQAAAPMTASLSKPTMTAPVLNDAPHEAKLVTEKLSVFYSEKEAIKGVDLSIPDRSVTALIGPSGCGKSTYLRSLNRMNDTIEGCRVTGRITLDGFDIYGKGVDAVEVRRRVGMVFQKSNPFPKSIFENVAFGLRIAGEKDKAFLAQRVEESLRGAAIWDEVKDRLNESALGLSGGQQQRLCIARTLAV